MLKINQLLVLTNGGGTSTKGLAGCGFGIGLLFLAAVTVKVSVCFSILAFLLGLWCVLLVATYYQNFFLLKFVRGAFKFLFALALSLLLSTLIFKTDFLFVCLCNIFNATSKTFYFNSVLAYSFLSVGSFLILYVIELKTFVIVKRFIANAYYSQELLLGFLLILWSLQIPNESLIPIIIGIGFVLILKAFIKLILKFLNKTDLNYVVCFYVLFIPFLSLFFLNFWTIFILVFLVYIMVLTILSVKTNKNLESFCNSLSIDSAKFSYHFKYDFTLFKDFSILVGQLCTLSCFCLLLKQTSYFGFEQLLPFLFTDFVTQYILIMKLLTPLVAIILALVKITIIYFCNPSIGSFFRDTIPGLVFIGGGSLATYVGHTLGYLDVTSESVGAYKVTLQKQAGLEHSFRCRFVNTAHVEQASSYVALTGRPLPIMSAMIAGEMIHNCVDSQEITRQVEILKWYHGCAAVYRQQHPTHCLQFFSSEEIFYLYDTKQVKDPNSPIALSLKSTKKTHYYVNNMVRDSHGNMVDTYSTSTKLTQKQIEAIAKKAIEEVTK